ncbi:MAG: pentapeptide repeat-containing protein [Thainema sp.]
MFTNAILDSVCLQNADLSYAIFESAYLGGADLQGANLQGAKFAKSSLKGIKHDMYTAWRKAEGLDLANDTPVEWS